MAEYPEDFCAADIAKKDHGDISVPAVADASWEDEGSGSSSAVTGRTRKRKKKWLGIIALLIALWVGYAYLWHADEQHPQAIPEDTSGSSSPEPSARPEVAPQVPSEGTSEQKQEPNNTQPTPSEEKRPDEK